MKHIIITTIAAVLLVGCVFVATQMAFTVNGADLLKEENEPDPRNLLEAVAKARQEIVSGKLQFEVFSFSSDRPLDGTNKISLDVVFDGENRRFEQLGREYSYVLMGPNAGKVTDTKRKELGLDKEGAVRAGLLKGFESHHVTTYDGNVILDYSETDGRPNQTKIGDPNKGSGIYVFDPRVLGLRPSLFVTATIEGCLDFDSAAKVEFIGKEIVEGIEVWHVRASKTKIPVIFDCWMDVEHPTHIVKSEFNDAYTFSKYDDANPTDPLPIEVRTVYNRGKGTRRFEVRFVRRTAQYNVPVDQASWTLAGLNMKVGTVVSDYRIKRIIGYWDGTGLSENLPRNTPRFSRNSHLPSNPSKLLTLSEKDPGSLFALESAIWVMLHTPDGPEVEKAADLILGNHSQSENLIQLCEGLERVRHKSSIRLLDKILKDNPDMNVQGSACFTLATLLKSQADEAGDKHSVNEAERLFQRVVDAFGQVVGTRGKRLADLAQDELRELRLLAVGKEAPEFEGVDLEGKKMKLSNFRGKVVVLNFWGAWCGPCMALIPTERKLVEKMRGKPFAMVGVNSDTNENQLKRALAKEKITWPSFRDGRQGPIAKLWNVRSWPTTYVLDQKGVIRYKNLNEQALFEAVEALILEM